MSLMLSEPRGTLRDRQNKSYVESPLRGENYTAQEIVAADVTLSTLVDFTDGQIIYLGTAEYAALSSESKWRIQKIDLTSGVAITNASDEYNQIWDNRASLTYV